MIKIIKLIFTSLLFALSITASEATRAELSIQRDDAGNLNPFFFIPIYYGSSDQYYFGAGYTSSSFTKAETVNGFSDSKNAVVSSSKDFRINFITYTTSFDTLKVSFGLESMFSEIKNNEFGYIHDSSNIFGNGADYFISFDNEIELDIKRHAVAADVVIPIGKFLTSRLSASVSPYTTLGVKQSTIFKPLVGETGKSSSSTVQKLAYSFKYEVQSKSGTFMDVGFYINYDYQPLKYEIAQLAAVNSSYLFKTNTIDTDEITKSYAVKLLFDKDMLGGLKPTLGFKHEELEQINNITNESTFIEQKIVLLGLEKLF